MSARRREVAREVPVAEVVGACFMQAGNALEDDFHLRLHALGCEQVADAVADFLVREGCVDGLDLVDVLLERKRQLMLARRVGGLKDVFHAALFEQGHGGLECNEIAHPGHVDAVAIGVPNLGCA